MQLARAARFQMRGVTELFPMEMTDSRFQKEMYGSTLIVMPMHLIPALFPNRLLTQIQFAPISNDIFFFSLNFALLSYTKNIKWAQISVSALIPYLAYWHSVSVVSACSLSSFPLMTLVTEF